MQNTLNKRGYRSPKGQTSCAALSREQQDEQSSIKESTWGQAEFLRINPATEYLQPTLQETRQEA